jgi:glutathione peroxidase
MATFFDHTARSITGEAVDLSDYAGKVSLVVNVASRCGLTKQYTGLQALQAQFADQGFNVLAFPCNQFGAQEPGTDEEIQSFACTRYDVSFPMFTKIDVNGPSTAPVYRFLKSATPNEAGEDLPWNFTKFLVGRDGQVIQRLGPTTTPEQIAELLGSHL